MQEPPQWEAIMHHLDIIKEHPRAKEFRTYLARIRVNDLKVKKTIKKSFFCYVEPFII